MCGSPSDLKRSIGGSRYRLVESGACEEGERGGAEGRRTIEKRKCILPSRTFTPLDPVSNKKEQASQ